jgi:hypothetical protein
MATGSDVTPKGIPLGVRMCNRKLGFPVLFSGVYENMKKNKKNVREQNTGECIVL